MAEPDARAIVNRLLATLSELVQWVADAPDYDGTRTTVLVQAQAGLEAGRRWEAEAAAGSPAIGGAAGVGEAEG